MSPQPATARTLPPEAAPPAEAAPQAPALHAVAPLADVETADNDGADAPNASPRKLQVSWGSFPFFAVHVACLAAFFLPFSWGLVGLAVGLYLVRMFGITAGYHRYFSHRSFKTGRVFQLVLALCGLISFQKGPLWWAAHHRHHHRHSDQEDDLHSPGLQGFLWAHVGWILAPDYDETDYDRVADWTKYPELVWLNKYHAVPGVVLGVLLFAFGGLPALVWGLFISTVATWHATFAINSLTHMIGNRRFETTDDSRNHWFLALLCLGEGWHNNHHHYKAAARQGFYWWEVDISYYVLRALGTVGIVWGIKEPPAAVLEAGRAADAARRQAA